MPGRIYGPIPEGTTINYSRRRTTIHFGRGASNVSIIGGDIYITGNGGSRRGSDGPNRGRRNNRQRRQRRHETNQVPHRTGNQFEHPNQPNASERTAEPAPTPNNNKNLAEETHTSNPPMNSAKPSLSAENTEGSQAAKNTWEALAGTTDYKASFTKYRESRVIREDSQDEPACANYQHDFTQMNPAS